MDRQQSNLFDYGYTPPWAYRIPTWLTPRQADGLNPYRDPPVKLEIVHAIMEESKLPKRPEALIEGILRIGGKMLLTGKSKSGKSFLGIQLGVCVANGIEWLGLPCRQGKVLYLNLEIDHAEFMKRQFEVATALGADPDLTVENFIIAKRPKQGLSITQFVNSLSSEEEAKGCSLVIIDPQYKIFDGSENEQRDMAAFYSEIDRLISNVGCAVLVIHHQPKGYHAGKDITDKASGSSVLSRDSDAIMDIGRLKHEGNAMRAEFVLRDYPPVPPIEYWFNHPICILDESGELAECVAAGGQSSSKGPGNNRALKPIVDCLKEMCDEEGTVKVARLADKLGKKSDRIKALLKKVPGVELVKVGNAWWAKVNVELLPPL